jgi:hypothetical protein
MQTHLVVFGSSLRSTSTSAPGSRFSAGNSMKWMLGTFSGLSLFVCVACGDGNGATAGDGDTGEGPGDGDTAVGDGDTGTGDGDTAAGDGDTMAQGGTAGDGDVDGPAMSANLLPAEGEAMTMLWESEPAVFGPWFTYAFHEGAAIDPAEGIKVVGGKMCATLSGTATAAGGGAIGFQVCGAPTYPNEAGEYAWFPLNCTDNPAETCVPSETAMPSSFCGANITGVRIVATGIIDKVEFKGPGDSNLGDGGTHAEVIPVGGYAPAPVGKGGDITAIHIKSFHDGEICLESVVLEYE